MPQNIMRWAMPPCQLQLGPFFPIPTPTISFSANAQPPRHQSSAIPKNQQQQQQQGEARRTKQLSGSDVLWAMQRAAAEKKNKVGVGGNKKRKGFVSGKVHREEDSVDYSHVKPSCIKSEWDARLDELEKRLKELSDTNK